MNEFEKESAHILSLSEERPASKEYDASLNKNKKIKNKLKKVKIILFYFLDILSIILSIILIQKGKEFLGIITIIINIIKLIFIPCVSTAGYNPFDWITPLIKIGIDFLIGIMVVIFFIYFLIFLFQQKKKLIFI